MKARTKFSTLNRSYIIGFILLIVLVILTPLVVLEVKRQQNSGNNVVGSPVAVRTTLGGANTPTVGSSAIRHFEYVFPDGGMHVYAMDNGHKLVKYIGLPTTAGVRGVVASPATRMLYISYGGDGGPNGNGSLLKYDLVADKIVWTKNYATGIDSMAITPDGKTIYMPDGELSPNGIWNVIDAATGDVIGTIDGGTGPHNTIVSLNGTHMYLGGRNYNYLEVADTSTNTVVKKIGPLKGGVRPFTVTNT